MANNALLFNYDPRTKTAVVLKYGLKKDILAIRKKYTKLAELTGDMIVSICLELPIYNLTETQQSNVCSYAMDYTMSPVVNRLVEGVVNEDNKMVMESINTMSK